MATRIEITEIHQTLGSLAQHLQSLHAAGWTVPRAPRGWSPPVNAFAGPDGFILQVELPGMTKEDIDLRVEPTQVTLRGTRPCCQNGAARILALEISHGPFERVINLPRPVDPDLVSARYEHGLLRVELPFAATAVSDTTTA